MIQNIIISSSAPENGSNRARFLKILLLISVIFAEGLPCPSLLDYIGDMGIRDLKLTIFCCYIGSHTGKTPNSSDFT